MKISAIRVVASVTLAAIVVFVLWRFLHSAPEYVNVAQPCNTFVSEFAPVPTPQLQPNDAQYELLVSFTPAKDEEADAVVAAVEAGTKRLIIAPAKVEAEALRIERGRLVLRAHTRDHATQLLRALCFKEPFFGSGK